MRTLAALLLLVAVIVGATIAVNIFGDPVLTKLEPLAVDGVSIVSQAWHRDRFNTVAIVDVIVKNGNDYAVKDFDLECQFYGQSGTRVADLTKTIFDRIEPKKTRSFKGLNMGLLTDQGARGACRVIFAQRIMAR